jgi:hypothetical protein
VPLGVNRSYQKFFLCSATSFDPLFFRYGFLNGRKETVVYQLVAVIPECKGVLIIMFPVLDYPGDQVTGNTCIQGCMVLIGKNINTPSFFHKQAA